MAACPRPPGRRDTSRYAHHREEQRCLAREHEIRQYAWVSRLDAGTDLRDLFGPLDERRASRLLARFLEADRLFAELTARVSGHTGVPYLFHGYHLYRRATDPLLSGDASGDAGDIVFEIAWPGVHRAERQPPPWAVSGQLIVKCDQQPERHYWCLHELIDEYEEVDSPEAAIEALIRQTGTVGDVVLGHPPSWVTEQRHESFESRT